MTYVEMVAQLSKAGLLDTFDAGKIHQLMIEAARLDKESKR